MMTQKDQNDESPNSPVVENVDYSEWTLGKLLSKSNETESDIEVHEIMVSKGFRSRPRI